MYLGKDRGSGTPGGSQVRVLMGRGRGTDIRTPRPPRGTLNVHAEFHFFPMCASQYMFTAGQSAMASEPWPAGYYQVV